jgi:steroid delta-isomerase-like uncharacterized protein
MSYLNSPKRFFRLFGIVLLLLVCASCQETATPGLTKEQANLIKTRYLEARNTPNLDLLDDIYVADVLVHDCSAPEDIRGLKALKEYYAGSHEGIPDFRISFDEVLAADETIVTRWTIEGTQSGTLRGLPPSNEKLRFSGTALSRVKDGKIIEEWVYFNVLDLMTQLGFSLQPPQAPEPSS